MGARENERQISQNYILHINFQNFVYNHNLVEFDINFLGIP